MGLLYIGLDLGSITMAGATIDADGKVLGQEQFLPSEKNLIHYVTQWKGEAHVLMEEGELAKWVHRTVKPHVEKADVCEPRFNAWISKAAKKSDPVDALKLAELCRFGLYHPVYQSETDEMAEFKIAVQQYMDIAWDMTAWKLKIKSMFRRQGILLRGRQVYDLKGRETFMGKIQSPRLTQMLRRRFRLLDFAVKEQRAAAGLVSSMGLKLPIVKRLQAAPGVGPVSAGVFVGYVQTPHRFRNKRQLWRYSRLGIIDRSSDGKPIGRQRLDPCGNAALKYVSGIIFHAALRTKDDNLFKRFYRESLERTKKREHARLSTQRKILTVLWTLWKEDTEYNDNPSSNALSQRA